MERKKGRKCGVDTKQWLKGGSPGHANKNDSKGGAGKKK